MAIAWLVENGYDCSDLVTDYDRLCNISIDGVRSEAIVNSIAGGVVYIRPVNWLKLMYENTILLLVNKTVVTKLDTVSDIIKRYPKTLMRVHNSADVEKHLAAIAEETSDTATTQFVFFDEDAKYEDAIGLMSEMTLNSKREIDAEQPLNDNFLDD